MAKQARLNFRSTDEFKKRLAAVAETLGLDQAVVATSAIEAVVKHVEEHGSLTIPIRLSEDAPDPAAQEPKITHIALGKKGIEPAPKKKGGNAA